MQRNLSLITKWILPIALVMVTLPATAAAQRFSVVVRPRRQRVLVYQPQPRVFYGQTYSTPYYGTQPYYGTRYYSYGYPTPYYGTGYSYNYSQPYYANPYAYTTPTYSYSYREYRPRYRRNRVRLGIYLR
ncbi:MAG TPA: hypothetical protein VE961_15215 [Pyrinomonadaceae bacterium]|nr:hypothetical protein [Pyrinomonadaceae bacterium]